MALIFLRSMQFVVPSEARASSALTNPLLNEAKASPELTNPLLRDHRPPCWNKRHRMPWQPSLQKVRRACYQDILYHYLMYLIFFMEIFLSFLSSYMLSYVLCSFL